MPFRFSSWPNLKGKLKKRSSGDLFLASQPIGTGPQGWESWSCLIAEKWPQQLPQGHLWYLVLFPSCDTSVSNCASKGMFPLLFTLGFTWSCWPLSRHLYCLLWQIRKATCSFIHRVLSVAFGGCIIAEGLKINVLSWNVHLSLALESAGTIPNAVCPGSANLQTTCTRFSSLPNCLFMNPLWLLKSCFSGGIWKPVRGLWLAQRCRQEGWGRGPVHEKLSHILHESWLFQWMSM